MSWFLASNRTEEAFHSKASIYQAMQHQRQLMQQEINNLPEAQIRSASVDQLAREIAEKFSINIPVIDEAAAKPDVQDVDIDISRDPMHRSFYSGHGGTVKGTEITITTPFKGDAEIFRFHASSHTMDYPRGYIGDTSIIFARKGQNLDGPQVRREYDGWLATIKQHLAGMRQELGNFNVQLLSESTAQVNTRIEKFKRDTDLVAGLGFGTPQVPS